ncbi:hypothetical protein [Lactobacillus sp. ESL0677]|uniref:hypothetical protein n=1 Tax=Lactobacillus sp. ESL0677 TaxID=2983208 RepID=UPI0023F94A8B|nr:hypothetical protein [Lactobacillus sp. ESL0677]WEV36236.1 hypothetical protein OZX76_05675 [Lactobacillus sp. ESL0677]
MLDKLVDLPDVVADKLVPDKETYIDKNYLKYTLLHSFVYTLTALLLMGIFLAIILGMVLIVDVLNIGKLLFAGIMTTFTVFAVVELIYSIIFRYKTVKEREENYKRRHSND